MQNFLATPPGDGDRRRGNIRQLSECMPCRRSIRQNALCDSVSSAIAIITIIHSGRTPVSFSHRRVHILPARGTYILPGA